jgi:hypothetical protein
LGLRVSDEEEKNVRKVLTLDDLPTELALLAVSAGKDLALRGESDKVVVSGGELDDGVALDVLERDGLELRQSRARTAVEAEKTLAML